VQPQYGFKGWYLIPNSEGTKVSTILKTAKFGTKEACLANVANPATKPAGAEYDDSAGKGTVCSCETPLEDQGSACNPL
jgi:hypothetical protein